ncbi:hypothetical protein AAMO2058_000611900 [Amorphochlora amoebiformis]
MSASPKRPYERLQRVTGALSRSMGIISKNTSAKNEPSRGGPWYLGFDLSSQSLKAEVIDSCSTLVSSVSVNFDKDLPDYKTTSGGYINGLRATAPSLMFVEALDLLLAKMEARGVDLKRVEAMSVSGQQHGSVWWKTGSETRLKKLDAKKSLKEQLLGTFSVPNGPTWRDASTEKECKEISNAIGGDRKVMDLSGSRTYERFTGNQIRKIYLEQPEAYIATERIGLISSMLTSVLIGGYAPIDVSDGSGMNLMNIRAKRWSWELIQAVVSHDAEKGSARKISDWSARAQELMKKLGGRTGVVESYNVVGLIDNYFVKRYGFSPNCRIVAGSGDNPCSLVGLRGTRGGDVIISLGTSDTLFAVTENPHMLAVDGHVMVNPVDCSTYIKMLCFKNGSLTREKVRAAFAGGTWEGFNAALERTRPGNDGNVGIYFLDPEIVPTFNTSRIFRFGPDDRPIGRFPNPDQEIRAVLEGHFLSMRLHLEGMSLPATKRVIATGGGSQNPSILQVIANIFKVPVYVHKDGSGSAGLGAAIRAVHGVKCDTLESFVSIDQAMQGCPDGSTFFRKVAEPKNTHVYDKLMKRYGKLEQAVVLVGMYDGPNYGKL